MEQVISRLSRRSGWSDYENQLLWETADEAQQQGLPLKAVFERISEKTGRRPNSIRNYYYAQVRQKEGESSHAARFVPFTQDEVDALMDQVLRARAAGQSVRSCLTEISGGDHSRMLRLQNKYRSVLKNRPDYVRSLVEKLNSEGVMCNEPQVNHRTRPDMGNAMALMDKEVRRQGDPELARAVEVIASRLRESRGERFGSRVRSCAEEIMNHVRRFVVRPSQERFDGMDEFCAVLVSRVDELETALGTRDGTETE